MQNYFEKFLKKVIKNVSENVASRPMFLKFSNR